MIKRWLVILSTGLVSLAALWGLLGWAAAAHPALAAAPAAVAPTVTGMTPALAANDAAAPVVITGAGFAATPTVFLGNTALSDVTWVNGTTLNALVPWGLTPGGYTLTVINSDGGQGRLLNAFTVTGGVNTWTTGGPYGGGIFHLTVNPLTPTTVYAAVQDAGLFVTDDAAGWWQQHQSDNYPLRQSMSPVDPQVVYVGGHNSFYRTRDGGHTWADITPPGGCIQFCSPAAHPTLGGVVYIGLGADPWPASQAGSIYRSDDFGATWVTRTVGLTDTQVVALAFYPDNPNHMVAGTQSGNLFVTVNGGLAWTWAAQVGTHVERLYVNPFGAHEVWVVSQMPFWPQIPPYLYRSLNPGLTDWAPVTLPNAWSAVFSLTFHPTISGTVWAAADNGYQSIDGGATWTPLTGDLPGGATVFAVDTSLSPTLLYAGTKQGIFKSQNNGASWQEADDGLAGVVPDALAVAPGQPDEIYASTQVRGLLKSNNGGHTWQALGTRRNGMPWQGSSLAVDPITATRLYLGEQCHDGPCLRISPNGGQSWQALTVTVPLTWSGWSGEVFAVAPHPQVPGRILVGATFYPPNYDWSNAGRPVGGIYISDDFGEHFTYRPTAPISGVVQFAYDAVDPNLVYAGTEGTGLWRSHNGGQTWELTPARGGTGSIWSVVADPWQHNTVWIGKWEDGTQAQASNVYSSTDAGQTWAPVQWPRYNQNGIRTLLFAPTQPSTLYVGTEGAGLYRTRDAGNSWELLPGMPADGTFYALATGTDGQRVAVYLGTGGGTATSSALTVPGAAQAGNAVMGAGVYRLVTLLLSHHLYLPRVSR